MYQALYRKWRPKTFSEVVGQEHITSTLQKQVAEDHIGHAYLFTGTRGTGKTTVARILAKAINCENPIDGAPCCKCNACLGIDNGSLLDVTELDAASNNGVEQVRTLREEAIYAPNMLKKRVYIIDEVHMLSSAAFNALLKILEEPPEHLVFILATTELHKVLPTILSRCQRFSFKRIQVQDMEKQLLMIAKAESIDLKPDGAEILARLANGALRDALSLLDQCRSIEGAIDSRSTLNVLGLAGSVQTLELMQNVLNEDTQATLSLFDALYKNGKDVVATLSELSDLARDFAIMKAAPDGGANLISGLYDIATLSEISKDIPMERFLHITALLQETCVNIGNSVRPRTDAELCLLRLCDESLCDDSLALASRVSKLETSLSSGVPVRVAPQKTENTSQVVKEPISSSVPEIEEVQPTPSVVKEDPLKIEDTPITPVEVKQAKQVTVDHRNVWKELMNFFYGNLPVNLRSFLTMATGNLEGNQLTVYCPSDFVKNTLDNEKVISVLTSVTEEKLGLAVRVTFVVDTPPKEEVVSAPKEATSAKGIQEEDPLASLISKGKNFDNFEIR